MNNRCYYKPCKDYTRYGGRGVIVEESLNTFDKFFQWSINNGFQPNMKLELDRKDNNGNYSSENCRWVSGTLNKRNTSRIKLTEDIAYDIRYGKYTEMCPKEIAVKLNCTVGTIKSVLKGKTWKEVY